MPGAAEPRPQAQKMERREETQEKANVQGIIPSFLPALGLAENSPNSPKPEGKTLMVLKAPQSTL